MTPESYLHWQKAARDLLEPLAALMQPGRACLDIKGPPSDHDLQADRLESFARPLLLAAHWLQTKPLEEDAEFREKIATWFRAGLVIGADSKSEHYWGPDANYHQHHVEIGLLCIALQIAPDDLWNPLSKDEKDLVARWLGTARGNGIVNNNHYFMGVHILEFLMDHGYEKPSDRPLVNEFLTRLELMHRGGGWFEDGINQAYDHYNAYAFHFYGLMWARLYGNRDTDRAQRWREWARPFVHDYQHFFSASGEHPAFGRSISYRFNCLNVFGMTVAEDCCDLDYGLVRRLCTRNLDFFISKPIRQEQGCLGLGWTDVFPPIWETYSCAGSPYWAAKGFAPLLIPPEHPFWNVPEQPLPAEQGDHAHVVKPAGLVVRSVDGAVEILNAGSQISNVNLRYGAWKWSKTAYRTGNSFTLAFPNQTNWSHDSALTSELDDGRIFGRHSTVGIEMETDHIMYSYSLGFKIGQVNTGVETSVWWNGGWILQIHQYEARQPVVMRCGGYPLPLAEPTVQLSEPGSAISAWNGEEQGTALQLIAGDAVADWDNRLDDSTERSHISAPYHATPIFRTERHEGTGLLALLSWTGSDKEESAAWTVVSSTAGELKLNHPKLGDWTIEHWSLPAMG
ncbi:MAG: DUF2264 domain-containing protein [Opitutaceae bacterium]